MDKLEKAKQAEVRKMSDVRLTGKLVQAGFSPEELDAMDREALLNRYAEFIMGSITVKPAASVSASVIAPYDVELERQKMAFQAQQWEDMKIEREE